jgi:hypothetical protein
MGGRAGGARGRVGVAFPRSPQARWLDQQPASSSQ